MINPEHKDGNWLVGVLQEAINAFNDGPDIRLLQEEDNDDGKKYGSVGECAITHRLAVHIERVLNKRGYPREEVPISVDCEYNRNQGAIKQHNVKEDLRARVEALKGRELQKHPEREGWYVFSIFPDIIVHRRGENTDNLVAVEVKRASNDADDELDCIKLHLFTLQDEYYGYQYAIGATVIALDQGEHRRLEIGRLIIDGTGRYRAAFLTNSPLKLGFLAAEHGSLTL